MWSSSEFGAALPADVPSLAPAIAPLAAPTAAATLLMASLKQQDRTTSVRKAREDGFVGALCLSESLLISCPDTNELKECHSSGIVLVEGIVLHVVVHKLVCHSTTNQTPAAA